MALGPKCSGNYHTTATGLRGLKRRREGTPCSVNNYCSHQRETFQITAVTKRESTVRKLVPILSKLLYFI